MRVLRAVAIAALVFAALSLATAWRGGPADYDCRSTTDREGNEIPRDEWEARRDGSTASGWLLVSALLAACAGGVTSLVGVVGAAITRMSSTLLLTFGGLLGTAALVAAVAFVSFPPFVPCLGE